MSTDPEAIMRDELAAAWKRQSYDESYLAVILADIEAHREPEYVPGGAYQDPDGEVWVYRPDASQDGSWADCPWQKPGDRGLFSRTSPKHPLRRLVPEWFPHLPDEQAIAGIITEWTDARHDALEAAGRIRKLIMEAAL